MFSHLFYVNTIGTSDFEVENNAAQSTQTETIFDIVYSRDKAQHQSFRNVLSVSFNKSWKVFFINFNRECLNLKLGIINTIIKAS